MPSPPAIPDPFPLSKKQVSELEKLGHRLFLFRQALDHIRKRSAKGKLPAWIAATLNGDSNSETLAAIPPHLCPDLILTADGWSLVDFAAPGDILPVAARLQRTCAPLTEAPLVPAASAGDLDALAAVAGASGSRPSRVPFALLHLRSLREIWRSELRDSQFQRLEKAIPYTWLLDPATLPPQAVIPHLELNSMRALAGLSPEARAGLVLKAPGVDTAVFGRDAADAEWRAAVTRALDESATTHAHILQEVVEPAVVPHPVPNPATDRIEPCDVTVRLTPVYTTQPKTATLTALLATLKAGDQTITAPCCLGLE